MTTLQPSEYSTNGAGHVDVDREPMWPRRATVTELLDHIESCHGVTPELVDMLKDAARQAAVRVVDDVVNSKKPIAYWVARRLRGGDWLR